MCLRYSIYKKERTGLVYKFRNYGFFSKSVTYIETGRAFQQKMFLILYRSEKKLPPLRGDGRRRNFSEGWVKKQRPNIGVIDLHEILLQEEAFAQNNINAFNTKDIYISFYMTNKGVSMKPNNIVRCINISNETIRQMFHY